MEQKIILVDKNDKEIGQEEKLKAHQNGGKLHRAISILVFNSKGETMLQQRAMGKYHAGGQWANTVCSHPMPNESVIDAAHRRLKQEMGFDCDMDEAFAFTYKADVGSGLTEHEFDHVIFGSYDGEPAINKDEVMDWKWAKLQDIADDIKANPEKYAPWFRIMLPKIIEQRKNR